MIVGQGIDIVCVEEFARLLEDPASRFLPATFTPAELAWARLAPSHDPARHLAARYAAKEAAIKALDLACARQRMDRTPLGLCSVEVVRDALWRPGLVLHGDAASLAERLAADRAWVSLSHDGAYAAAVVTLERDG